MATYVADNVSIHPRAEIDVGRRNRPVLRDRSRTSASAAARGWKTT